MNLRLKIALSAPVLMLATAVLSDQPPPANYDEGKVPHYTLPNPLVSNDGQRVADAETWRDKRRREIVHLFEKYVYGKAPPKPQGVIGTARSPVDRSALGGTAIRKEVTVKPGKIDVLIYLPKKSKGPIPVFLGLNFDGNHTIHSDPGITPSNVQKLGSQQPGKPSRGAVAMARGSNAHRWPIEKIHARGYGVATAWYGDIEPDMPGRLRDGVRGLYLKPGQDSVGDDEWGAIAAWAWGLSRIMDYLQSDPDIDSRHVAVIGHSRLGKTALWAGALDERFALVISNDSGCGGASLARRQFGETPARICTAFPHWFCKNYVNYAFHVNDLPVDQHMLMALIAPRPLYIASAEEDLWADPHGEFLSAKGADPVYRLLGTEGLPAAEMPAVQHPVAGTVSYHIRHGKHDVTDYDWQQYLDCADRNFKLPK
jgi:hypothetical protein